MRTQVSKWRQFSVMASLIVVASVLLVASAIVAADPDNWTKLKPVTNATPPSGHQGSVLLVTDDLPESLSYADKMHLVYAEYEFIDAVLEDISPCMFHWRSVLNKDQRIREMIKARYTATVRAAERLNVTGYRDRLDFMRINVQVTSKQYIIPELINHYELKRVVSYEDTAAAD